MQRMESRYVERPPDPPEIKWALDLLEPEPRYRDSILQEYYHYIIFPGIAVAYSVITNKVKKLPNFHNPLLLSGRVAIGLLIGHLVGIRQNYVAAKKDTMMRDYIRAHPEHFPDPNIKKWGDIFEPWTPCR